MSLFQNVSGQEKDTICLQIGAPGEDLLKRAHRVFQECLLENAKLDEESNGDFIQLFQYGPKEGPPKFRSECSKFSTEQYGDTVCTIDNLQDCSRNMPIQPNVQF